MSLTFMAPLPIANFEYSGRRREVLICEMISMTFMYICCLEDKKSLLYGLKTYNSINEQ